MDCLPTGDDTMTVNDPASEPCAVLRDALAEEVEAAIGEFLCRQCPPFVADTRRPFAAVWDDALSRYCLAAREGLAACRTVSERDALATKLAAMSEGLAAFCYRYARWRRSPDPAVSASANIAREQCRRLLHTASLPPLGAGRVVSAAPDGFSVWHRVWQRALSVETGEAPLSPEALYGSWCFLALVRAVTQASDGDKPLYRRFSPAVIRVGEAGVSALPLTAQTVYFENDETGRRLTLTYHPADRDAAATVEMTMIRPDRYEPRTLRWHIGETEVPVLPYVYRLVPPGGLDEYPDGIVPCFPGHTQALEKKVCDHLRAWAREVPERRALSRAEERELERVDWTVKEVLVGSLRNPRQYEINLSRRFYHTPAVYIDPRCLPRYIALFCPGTWPQPGIWHYGKVIGGDLVKRRDVPIPVRRRNDDEPYYLFRVERWQSLPRPIDIKEEGVFAPRFTSWFLLTHSRWSYELFHTDSEETYRMMVTLRELLAHPPAHCTVTPLDRSHTVRAYDGWLDLCDATGTVLAHLHYEELRQYPGYFWEIMAHYRRT